MRRSYFRLLTVILTALAVFALLNAGQTARADTHIDNVVIKGVERPFNGISPSYTARAEGPGYGIQDYNSPAYHSGILWREAKTHKVLDPDSKFVGGVMYEVIVCIKPKPGYVIDEQTTATINDRAVTSKALYVDGTATFNYIFCCYQLGVWPKPIDDLVVTVTEPVAGKKPSYEYTASGETAYVYDENGGAWKHGLCWRDRTENRDMTPEDVFVAGHKYMVTLAVRANEGYYFDSMHGSVTINDQSSSARYGFCAYFDCKAAHLFPEDIKGFYPYNGGLFFVEDGDVVTIANGIYQDPAHPETWYFCSNGQAQLQYTGLAEYDGEWFYLENGVLDTRRNGLVSYDGESFVIAVGRILGEYSGLIQDPNTGIFYYVAAGRVVQEYTGLAEYDSHWFYIQKGVLDTSFHGTVKYNGQSFNVRYGMVE